MHTQESVNALIDRAWLFCPFRAWDIIAQELVIVIGWCDLNHYRLSTGAVAHPSTVTCNIPQFVLDGEAEMADAQDERDTYDSAYGPAVQ